MKLKDTKRRRYDLYLLEDSDTRLIAHLDGFTAARRTNEELRRMLYLALDYGNVQPTRPAPTMQQRTAELPVSENNAATYEVQAPPADLKGKLKKMFGTPAVG